MIWHLVLCIVSRYSTQTRDAAYPGRIPLPALCARLLLLLPGFSSLPVACWAIFYSRQKKKVERGTRVHFYSSGVVTGNKCMQGKKKRRKWEELCTVQRYSNKKQMVQNKSSYVDVFGSICQRKTKIKFDFFFSSVIRI